ncbi:hypothetical protein PanWU01x14_008860, partial [Parasponia andersonii]
LKEKQKDCLYIPESTSSRNNDKVLLRSKSENLNLKKKKNHACSLSFNLPCHESNIPICVFLCRSWKIKIKENCDLSLRGFLPDHHSVGFTAPNKMGPLVATQSLARLKNPEAYWALMSFALLRHWFSFGEIFFDWSFSSTILNEPIIGHWNWTVVSLYAVFPTLANRFTAAMVLSMVGSVSPKSSMRMEGLVTSQALVFASLLTISADSTIGGAICFILVRPH